VYRSLKVVDLCEACAKPLLDVLRKRGMIDDDRSPAPQSESRSA
jgi:hypothetical protein